MTNRAPLHQREQWFIERLNEKGKFKYIGGYVNMKSDVLLEHKACGSIVKQKAYTVIYSDIDKCYECSRHRRGYNSLTEKINNRNGTLGIVGREKFGTRYRYECVCRECGNKYYFSKTQLEQGITCCDEKGVSKMDKMVQAKAHIIAKELRNNENFIGINSDFDIRNYIKNSFNDIALIRSCVFDKEKFFTKIEKEVINLLEEKSVGVCPLCNKKVKNKTDWKRDLTKQNDKICRECYRKIKAEKNEKNIGSK